MFHNKTYSKLFENRMNFHFMLNWKKNLHLTSYNVTPNQNSYVNDFILSMGIWLDCEETIIMRFIFFTACVALDTSSEKKNNLFKKGQGEYLYFDES